MSVISALLAAVTLAALPAWQQPGPPALRVLRNEIVTILGEPVQLRGVNVCSMEWSNEGENVVKSAKTAVSVWKANLIRLPVSQDRWLGKAPGQIDGGTGYRKVVDQVLDICRESNTYLMIDLHWANAGQWGKNIGQRAMPDDNSTIFWVDVAKRYQNDPCVLFDLFNEPRDVDWFVWKDGGPVAEKQKDGSTLNYRTPGMQGLLDGIRATGAKNLVVAGGLDWAYDLRGIGAGNSLKDPKGNGVVYGTHVYPWKKDWDKMFGFLTDKYPVFVGEVGCEVDEKYEDPYVWGPTVMAYIQSKKLSWAAWSFHPTASPSLIRDWEYEPTSAWGSLVRQALAGAKFQPLGSR